VSAPVSAETANIDAARGFFTSLGEHLSGGLSARVYTARATLAGRRTDTATLAILDRISAHITAMAATCESGVGHLDAYHGSLEQAVNSTPEAADTDFYRPDTTTAAAKAAAAGPGGRDLHEQEAEPDELDDVLGFADGEKCHGTDQVHAAAGPATAIALVDGGDGADSLPFVTVATSPGRWNPLTWEEGGRGGGYAAPHLSPDEAEQAAQHLDELAEQAEAGFQPPKPSKWGRAAQRLQHLLDADRAARSDKIGVGEDEEFPLSVGDLLKLLQEKDPAATQSPRRRVFTQT
jgi:hypothetical protein